MRDGLAVVGEVLSVHGLAGADAIWCSKDLQPLRAGDETSTALERAFDYNRSKAALLLLTKHWTRTGFTAVAQAAVDAAKSRRTTVPAQHLGELITAGPGPGNHDPEQRTSQP